MTLGFCHPDPPPLARVAAALLALGGLVVVYLMGG